MVSIFCDGKDVKLYGDSEKSCLTLQTVAPDPHQQCHLLDDLVLFARDPEVWERLAAECLIVAGGLRRAAELNANFQRHLEALAADPADHLSVLATIRCEAS